ncbi:MAG: hypothetical protein V1866_07120 [archaeon]
MPKDSKGNLEAQAREKAAIDKEMATISAASMMAGPEAMAAVEGVQMARGIPGIGGRIDKELSKQTGVKKKVAKDMKQEKKNLNNASPVASAAGGAGGGLMTGVVVPPSGAGNSKPSPPKDPSQKDLNRQMTLAQIEQIKHETELSKSAETRRADAEKKQNGENDRVGSLDYKLHGNATGGAKALFWIAIALQIADVYYLKSNRTNFLPFIVACYAALSIGAWIVMKPKGHFVDPRHLFLFLGISAFYILIPGYMYLVPRVQLTSGILLVDWLSFIIAILPMWPIYFGFKLEIPFVKHYVNFWIILLLFLFIFGYASELRAGNLAAIGARPEMMNVNRVLTYLWDTILKIGGNLGKTFTNVIPNLLNATGISYYTGTVDQNEKAPVGLYISNIRAADKYSYEGYPVIIWADIRGKSFTEPIIVNPACYINDVGQGILEPSSFSFLGEEHDTLSCTFNDLKKGNHQVKVGASFNFETWAYVTYTFVDNEVRRSLEMQGKNINSELDIPMLPEAIFTNGPAMLGMGSMIDQPIGIDPLRNTRDPVLGVTLDNRWTDGQIAKVEGFVIQVPEDFDLVNCDRWGGDYKREPSNVSEGYAFYVFNREELMDPRSEFQSVTCRIHLKDELVRTFFVGSQKVQRTFVAQAKYIYKIEKPISVYVRE